MEVESVIYWTKKVTCDSTLCLQLEVTVESKNKDLKHLGFVRIAAIQTFVIVSNLYEYAKQNSGPLRSVVGTVENTVTTILGPVCNKFKDVPDDVLVFVDKKVKQILPLPLDHFYIHVFK